MRSKLVPLAFRKSSRRIEVWIDGEVKVSRRLQAGMPQSICWEDMTEEIGYDRWPNELKSTDVPTLRKEPDVRGGWGQAMGDEMFSKT